MRRGFAIIEMMIAMTILLMVLVAVTMTSFGTQSFLIGSQTSAEALNQAQGLLEASQAAARKDFQLVNDVASTTDGIYEKSVRVRLKEDQLTKEVTALVAWQTERGATRSLQLTTLIANFDTPTGGTTCDSNLAGDWARPTIGNATTDFAQLVGDSGSMYTLADVDAYKGKLYVVASNTAAPTKPTLFIFDVSGSGDPVLLGKVDNEGAGGTVAAGLNAVRVAEDPASAPVKTYAYLANAYLADYATCDPTKKKNCGQLAIADVTPPTFTWIGWSPTITNLMIASSTAPSVTGTWAGNALHYRNGYLLLGLKKNGGTGAEFHVIDVHSNSLSALLGAASHVFQPIGSYVVGHDVNAIAQRGTYAYIAVPYDASTQELQVIDMNIPSAMSLAGGYDVSGLRNGKSLALVGNRLYLGATNTGSGTNLYILDNTTPGSALTSIGSAAYASSVNALVVRDTLAFVLTNTALLVQSIGTPTSVAPVTLPAPLATLTLPVSGSTEEPSMDCEGNRLYITSNSATGRGALYVIKPGS